MADRLRKLLEQRGLSQTHASERAGIPLATLNKWINQADKAPNPSAENLIALKEAFNVSLDWLLTGQGLHEPIPSYIADVWTRLTSWLRSSIGLGALDPERIDVVRPEGDRLHLQIVRVDELAGPGIIFEDIKRQIAEAKVVIAEITAPNQNVFYELGYAHALNKPTILLAQRGKELPFDIRSYRVIFYDDSIGGKAEVEQSLDQHLRAVLQDDA